MTVHLLGLNLICHLFSQFSKLVNWVFDPFFHLFFQVLKPLDVKTKFYNAEVIFIGSHPNQQLILGQTCWQCRTLGFIRRNLKDCTRTVKETSYTAIVRPTIEYAATVWDPTSQSKIKALENIQRRAARFVTNNYTDRTPGCVTNMITSLGWQSLEHRRHNSRLCMLYKIQHNLIDINRDLYIRHNDSRTRGQHRLFQERTNNDHV
jgi:hypothetical protein